MTDVRGGPVPRAAGTVAPPTLAADGDPVAWTAAHARTLRDLVLQHGAVHVTGLGIGDGATVGAVRDAVGAIRAESAEPFAECRPVGDGVYMAPEWAPDREMCLHHEQSYTVRFPGLLVMAYVRPADTGGAMLLGDTRRVHQILPSSLVRRFGDQGWQLVRNFRSHLGLPWPAIFGTTDPREAESQCAARSIDFRWLRDGTLRTTQHRSAVIRHPATGERCWFNDVAFFSQWSVPEPERELMLETFGPDGLPFNTCPGDGRYLDKEDFDALLGAYDRATVRLDWQAGDLLLLDNLLTAHGREVYTGDREVLVAPAEPVARSACETG